MATGITTTIVRIRTTGLRDEPVLQALRQETAKLPMAIMQLSPEQGAFMGNLMRIMGATKKLNQGTFEILENTV
mgnify:CR=1 FL=1